MVTNILEIVAQYVVFVIEKGGYLGVILLMGIESACIPVPSELIMPFAGYLVSRGEMNFWWASLAGGFGCLWGSMLAYYIGKYGGRLFIEKYGKYILISGSDLDLADKWFKKYGVNATFFSRLMPVIRTFISLPAGIAKVDLKKFIIYSFVGSVIWSMLLVYLGMVLGEHWRDLKVYFHRFDLVIGILIVIFVIWYIRRHFKK